MLWHLFSATLRSQWAVRPTRMIGIQPLIRSRPINSGESLSGCVLVWRYTDAIHFHCMQRVFSPELNAFFYAVSIVVLYFQISASCILYKNKINLLRVQRFSEPGWVCGHRDQRFGLRRSTGKLLEKLFRYVLRLNSPVIECFNILLWCQKISSAWEEQWVCHNSKMSCFYWNTRMRTEIPKPVDFCANPT